MAAIGLAKGVAAGELVVAHVGPFTGPLAGNGLADHKARVVESKRRAQPVA
jgi:hypothetical protein